MNLENYLTNNSFFIVPSNLKIKLIKYLNSLNKMYNIKILSFNDIKKALLFDYDTKTIHYIMNKNNIDYNNALELINNMYYLFEDVYENKKIDNLNNLKKELLDKSLLTLNPYFKSAIKNKDIFIYGFDYLNRYYLKLIDILKEYTNVTIIPKSDFNYKHQVYSFDHLNNEIEFIASDIINKKLDLNHVYLFNINNDNESTIKRIFNNYNLPINFNLSTSLYETKVGSDFLNNLDNIDNYLNSLSDNNIKDLLINILNKYYWIDNKNSVKEMIKYELMHTFLPCPKYQNGINETSLFNEYFSEDDYIYIVSFNDEYLPQKYKDTDFINDNEKFDFLELTSEKNNLEKDIWQKVLQNNSNIIITSSKQNYNSILKPSSLIKDLNLEIVNYEYHPSNYSNKSNLYNLGILLDNYQKNNDLNKYLPPLINTYQNHNYQTYSNTFEPIKLKDDFKINLSYSKMNTYFECPFKYYAKYVLALDKYEDTFDTWLGSMCHYILSKVYDDDFDYEKAKDDFINEKPFELTKENALFLNKILGELKIAIKYIKGMQNITKYQTIETEKNINVQINDINFNGIIDKVMKYDNNIVLVDYKTGKTDIDLRLAPYGLNLQLPTYLFLIKNIYPDSNIVGIYLEHILKPSINKSLNENAQSEYEKSLKLSGYTLADEAYIKDFDPTYENSDYINGLKMTANGFSANSKVLNADKFNKLIKLTENKINECLTNIKKGNFEITSKMVGPKNISCEYCPYNSVCYKSDKDNIYLKLDDNLSFLEGDNNELY